MHNWLITGLGGGLTLCMVLACLVLFFANTTWNTRINRLNEYVTNPENTALYQANVAKSQTLSEMRSYNDLCDQYIDKIEQKIGLEAADIRVIDQSCPKGVTIDSYQYDNEKIVFSCRTQNKNAPSDFAKKLTKTKAFANVNYTGFSSSGETDGHLLYGFKLECTIKKIEGKG